MAKTFEYSLQVRGYELDSFNHLNNAVYINYLEQARWEVFKETDTLRYLTDNKILPAVIDTTIRYIREIRLFDDVIIKTDIAIEEPYMSFKHVMYIGRQGKISCKSKTRLLFLGHDRRPIDVPEYIRKKLGC
ncbi:acyl-CoA thioesterase [Acidobacteriota bacterium]